MKIRRKKKVSWLAKKDSMQIAERPFTHNDIAYPDSGSQSWEAFLDWQGSNKPREVEVVF